MSILARILAVKADEVAAARAAQPLRLEVDRPRHQHHVMPRRQRGLGHGISHPPAAGVREVTDVVEVFASGASGDEDAHGRIVDLQLAICK